VQFYIEDFEEVTDQILGQHFPTAEDMTQASTRL
jgi:hypothetical protein